MRITFLLDDSVGSVEAEWCVEGYTLEQLQDLWPSHHPGRLRERIIAVSERQYPASEYPDDLLRVSEEAFELGMQYERRQREESERPADNLLRLLSEPGCGAEPVK